MSKHADLAAMVSFVGEHVAEHLVAGRPGFGQGVPAEYFDTATFEGFGQHLGADGGAFA